MQLAVRLAATLLALTGIPPAAHAGAVPAHIGKAITDQAHEHKLRAIAHISYLDHANTLVSQRLEGFAHSVRDQPVSPLPGTNMTSPGIASDADLASVTA